MASMQKRIKEKRKTPVIDIVNIAVETKQTRVEGPNLPNDKTDFF